MFVLTMSLSSQEIKLHRSKCLRPNQGMETMKEILARRAERDATFKTSPLALDELVAKVRSSNEAQGLASLGFQAGVDGNSENSAPHEEAFLGVDIDLL